MSASGYQLAAMHRKNEYDRLSPEQKLAKACWAYTQRRGRSPGRLPEKMHVRVLGTTSGGKLFVLVMRRSYLASRTLDGLLKKMVLGGWRRIDTCKGPAKRAFP